MLTDGAGEPRGIRKVDLLQSDLCIPPLQVMHRYLAKYQMIQAKLFLFMDKLEHTELLCMEAFRGKSEYSKHKWLEPPKEDDVASTAESGIAHFPRSALKPLETQGRGFAHGHELSLIHI